MRLLGILKDTNTMQCRCEGKLKRMDDISHLKVPLTPKFPPHEQNFATALITSAKKSSLLCDVICD